MKKPSTNSLRQSDDLHLDNIAFWSDLEPNSEPILQELADTRSSLFREMVFDS